MIGFLVGFYLLLILNSREKGDYFRNFRPGGEIALLDNCCDSLVSLSSWPSRELSSAAAAARPRVIRTLGGGKRSPPARCLRRIALTSEACDDDWLSMTSSTLTSPVVSRRSGGTNGGA